ncbi:MAG: beta-lactamase family protein [Candidatus Latescibacteria bacterium]|nr:beta-lactamase family protein [Candidatus Latescibacterota bacterium]
MKCIRHLLAVVIGLMMGTEAYAADPPAGFSNAWMDVETSFAGSLSDMKIAGGTLIFVQDGAVMGQSLYGLADTETSRPVDANTIFHWGSITKTLTGIAIMQLRDRGKLTLDDALVKHLPELRDVHNPFGAMTDITIRQVMSHSAGFRGSSWPWGGSESWHPHEPKDWAQLVAMIPYTQILFEPGSRYSYSNPAIIFLGRIIEQISGDDFEVYMDKNVLRPLGMHQTYYDRSPYHLMGDRSNSYFMQEGIVTANGLEFDTGITAANGGLNAPMSDMVRYLGFLTGSPSTYDILDRSSLEEMWEPVIPISTGTDLTQIMGLSFFILKRGETTVFGHTGTQKGFHSFMYIEPDSRTAALFVVNTYELAPDSSPTRELSARIRDMLFDRIFPLFSQK